MKDTTLKFLLATIAVALWGLLLRPLLAATPVQAAPSTAPPAYPAMTMQQGGAFIYVVEDRTLYMCEIVGGAQVRIISKTSLR